MKKKIFSFLLILILLVSATPLTGIDFTRIISPKAVAATNTEIFTWGDYEYRIINTNEVEITAYWGSDTEVIIPSEIDEKPVTVIGSESFTGVDPESFTSTGSSENYQNNRLIKSIYVPSSVKTIEYRAFDYLISLEKVTLCEGLTEIKGYAFNRCPLLTEIELPNSLVSLVGTAFADTGIEELTFGSSFNALDYTYFGTDQTTKSNIKKATMNADDNYIINWRSSSKNNSTLTEIICNGKLRYNDWVYTESMMDKPTIKIEKIICNNGIDYEMHLILEKYFDSAINEPDGTIVYCRTRRNQFEPIIELPSLNEKESNEFVYYLNDKNEAVISRYIGKESDVIIPDVLDGYKVTSIAAFAFGAVNESQYEDYKYYIPETLIETITIPNTINHIGRFAFAGNRSLKKINIPESILEIPDEAFRDCSSLKNITIPETISKLGYASFSGCVSLETVIIKGVTKIDDYAFENCKLLKNIYFSNKLKTIGEFGFTKCTSIESIDLSNVDYIGSGAFSECENLKKVVLNNEIEKLEEGVFYWCFSLCEINLPKNLKIIGGWCFDSTAVTEMIFPEGLKTIEESAFYLCNSLETITLPESIESIWCFAFAETSINSLTIPKNLKNLGYRAFWRCYNVTTLYFYANNCKVTDHGFEYLPTDWDYASPFDECNIKNIYLGNDVTALSWNSMQYGTFENCTVLESVTIPESVEVIGTAAFKNCSNLEAVFIPDSVEEIADDAFVGCNSLTIYCSETSYAYSYATANNISVSTLIISAIPNKTYTGNAIKPAVTVTVASTILTKDVDYSVSYSNNINVGQATVIVNGMGEYANFSSKANFTIVTRKINKAEINDIQPQKHTGKPVEPSLTITDNGRYLKEGKDYTVNYSNNTNQGTAYVYISGIGNYSGSAQKAFEIRELDNSEVFRNWFLSFITDFFAKLVSFFSLL